jgi:steroid delta-isomerase-like uncharacterized protein
MENQKETILHRWFEEVWNQGRAEAIDELSDAGLIAHGLVDANGDEIRGVDAFKEFYKGFRGAFPDIQVIVEATLSEGDQIAARCTVKATHTGEGIGLAPRKKPVEFTGMCWVIIKDGKIAEAWNSFDFMTMFQQLDALNLAAR